MPQERNRARLAEAAQRFNDGDLDAYLEIYDRGVVLHGYPPGLPPGVSGARAFYESIFAAFSDLELIIDETIAEGELIAARFRTTGRHSGEFMGTPATGNSIVLEGQTILRFVDGRIAERWQAADMLGLLGQIGALPPPG